MGIEFRLGRSDHKVAEDFLVDRPAGVDGIWVEAHNVSFQRGVIEAARTASLEVLVEPLTERLEVEGFSPKGLSYAKDGPIDLNALLRGQGHEALIEAVVKPQLQVATSLVPPHFCVDRDDLLELNGQDRRFPRRPRKAG